MTDFLAWYESRMGVSFRVVDEPNPPEAIIQSRRLTRWVEVVDAFWSGAWARDQYSFATPGEVHQPIADCSHAEPDTAFAHSFVRAVSKKIAKASYLPVVGKYGPGYLVVNVDYPLYDRHSYRAAKELWNLGKPWDDVGCFRDVFLRIRAFDGCHFQRWSISEYGS